jgi:hypothetical protein
MGKITVLPHESNTRRAAAAVPSKLDKPLPLGTRRWVWRSRMRGVSRPDY